MPSACFDANSNVSVHWKHAEGMSLRYDVIVLGDLIQSPSTEPDFVGIGVCVGGGDKKKIDSLTTTNLN